MRTEVRWRVAVAGAELQLLVLAPEPGGCVGVDLESGAFVRAIYPTDDARPLPAYTVAVGQLGPPLHPPDSARPEAVELVAPPRSIGHLTPRQAERYLGPLHQPATVPLLGFAGLSIPYWTLGGDRPSLTLVRPSLGPQARWTDDGYECRFAWQGMLHQLPFGDRRLVSQLERLGRPRVSPRELARLLGYRPGRLLVLLSPPDRGYCAKKVAALLP